MQLLFVTYACQTFVANPVTGLGIKCKTITVIVVTRFKEIGYAARRDVADVSKVLSVVLQFTLTDRTGVVT